MTIVMLPNGQKAEFPDNMTNQQIEAVLQKQFAPSMDEGTQQPTTGFKGIAQDIIESLRGAPSAIGSALAELPHEAYESGKQAVMHPIRALENLASGAVSGVKGAYNLPLNLSTYLGKKDIPYFKQISPLAERLKIGDTGLQKAVLGDEEEGDPLLQGIGGFTPYTRLGNVTGGIRGVGKRAAQAGAYAGGQEQDPLTASLMGLVGEGAGRAVTEGVSRLRPSRMIKTPLSAEELQKALEQTQGTETSLGSVIENPFLQQQYENVLSKIPMSGANQAMQRTAQQVISKGENILDDMLKGQAPEDIGLALQDALKKAEQEAQAQKRANYEKVNKIADEAGINVGRENLATVAQEHLEDLRKSPELLRETDKKLLDDLQALSDPTQSNTLRLSNIFRGKLGDRAHEAWTSGDGFGYNLYRSMRDALDKDINQAIEGSENESLKKAHQESKEYYKKNIAPFEEPEIMRFTRRGGDPDMLANSFLRISRVADRSNLLKKLITKLPQDQRDLVSYAYYSRAMDEGKLNPLKLKTLHKQLGEKQRKILLGDEKLAQKLNDYTSLVEKNTEPLTLMFNPKTGQRMLSEFPLAALFGALGHAATGNVASALASTLLPGLLSRPLIKGLTSPKARERLIQKMIKEKQKTSQYDADLPALSKALSRALVAEQRGR